VLNLYCDDWSCYLEKELTGKDFMPLRAKAYINDA